MKKLEKVNLSKLKPYENNPRKNEEAIEVVVQSIKQCGYVAPIIVDENYEILAGHTRYQALKRFGYDEADVLIIDNLTEEQKRKYRLLDNKTNEFAGWDWSELDRELDKLDFEDFDFEFPNYDDIDIDEVFDQLNEPIEKKIKTIICAHCGKEIEI